jgi:chromosome partitioning protein
MGKIIVTGNQKGGVGKTCACYNLAYGMATIKNKKTLLIDLDPSGNSTSPFCNDIPIGRTIREVLVDKYFDPRMAILHAQVNDELVDNLHIIPSSILLATIELELTSKINKEKLLAKQLEKIRDDFDYIFIDVPPLLSVFTIIASYAADDFIIPVKYEKDALEGIADLFKTINDIKEDHIYTYKILRNALDARKKNSVEVVNAMLQPYIAKDLVFNTIIHQDEELNKAKFSQQPILSFAPKSQGAKDYLSLIEEITNAKD